MEKHKRDGPQDETNSQIQAIVVIVGNCIINGAFFLSVAGSHAERNGYPNIAFVLFALIPLVMVCGGITFVCLVRKCLKRSSN
jgi:hypothetical protein